MTLRVGSLCSGYGGLDLAVEEVFGARTLWHAEVDANASKVLSSRWSVPNHGDLTKIDWGGVEPIDVMTAGWPCQPWSHAGKQLGADDERAIWPEIARAIRILRPRYVVLENVSAVVRVGELQRVADSLSRLGYDLRWTCLRAADVGAPHGRQRLFVVAANTDDGAGYGEWPCTKPWKGSEAVGGIDLLPTPRVTTSAMTVSQKRLRQVMSGEVEETADCRLELTIAAIAAGKYGILLPTPNASDGSGGGQHPSRREGHSQQLIDYVLAPEQWGKYAPAIKRWESLTRPAPSPTEPNTKGNPHLSARFAEWMMGLPAGWVTDVDLPRSAHLKILGNGVVPAQAKAALLSLLQVVEVT